MNKQLIERLRNGEAAILNPDEFSHENLNRVLANAINNGINEMASGVMRYYWFDNGILICSDYAPTHITAAPLSQFFEEEKSGLDLKEYTV